MHRPGTIVSHTTAAELYQLPVPKDPVVHLTVAGAGSRSRRVGISTHAGSVERARMLSGVRVAHPLDLFMQLAGMLGLIDLVVVGDAMVHRRLATPEELVRHCAEYSGRHAAAARRAAALVRARVESPMETRLRLLLVLAGLPEPEINREMVGRAGGMRLDMSYPEVKVAVEYDGRQHAENTQQWRRDVDRREELDRMGWRIIVVTSEGIFKEPARTVARVFEVLRERGQAGLPKRAGDAWRAYLAA